MLTVTEFPKRLAVRVRGPLDAVVGVRAEIYADARTAAVLGTEREGSGERTIRLSGVRVTGSTLLTEAQINAITRRPDVREGTAEAVELLERLAVLGQGGCEIASLLEYPRFRESVPRTGLEEVT